MSEPVQGIGVHDLSVALRNGAILIDVREPHEFDEVHVPGAFLVPLQTVPDHVQDIPTDQKVYLICRSGGRSHHACEWLRKNDVDAINVLGGTLSWIEADLPTESGPAVSLRIMKGENAAGEASDDPSPNETPSNDPSANEVLS
jgi:rhodanese-related sulfurtransferase